MKRSVLLLVFWIAGFALPGFAVYKEVIQLQQSVALLRPSLPLVLLQGCGAELLKAHTCFVEVIEAYVHEMGRG